MDEQVDLWTEPRRRVAQEALLQSGVPAKAARSVASSELRGWSPSDITTLFNKVVDRRQPMHSFGVVFKVQQGRHAWVRAPDDLRRLSAESGLALCINTQGKWSLRKAGYIAISHVWEEGIRASDNDEGVPLELVQQIGTRIKLLEAEWIWLDVLAIPSGNKSLTGAQEMMKNAIINSLASIYQNADNIVVFDACTMRLRSTNPLEAAVTLACGKWMTRLWTLQEIALAKQAVIATATGFVDFKTMLAHLAAASDYHKEDLETLGDFASALSEARASTIERSAERYEPLFLLFARTWNSEQKKIPTLSALALCCHDRRTGNDIDYARAFFPLLELTWKTDMVREEGMHFIYDSQRNIAKRMLLMHGAPRAALEPSWAPAYLTGLEGKMINYEEHDIQWERRGLSSILRTCKVTEDMPCSKEGAVVLRLAPMGSESSVTVACSLSANEKSQTINGFRQKIKEDSAFLLTNQVITFPTSSGFGVNVLLVERDTDVQDADECWVYMTAALVASDGTVDGFENKWMIRHESPFEFKEKWLPSGTGKGMGELKRMMGQLDFSNQEASQLCNEVHCGPISYTSTQLASRPDLETPNGEGWRPLHAAAAAGIAQNVTLLLEAGAQKDATDRKGRTALCLASERGHLEVARILIAAGANVNYLPEDAMSALAEAIIASNNDMVSLLLEAGADANLKGGMGLHPLILACEKSEMIALLLEYRADPNAYSGLRPLHAASRAGNAVGIELLLAAGGEVNAPVTSGCSATPLVDAAEHEQEEAVETLLRCGADPNLRDDKQWTPLHHAAQNGASKIASRLIASGADLHGKAAEDARTPLHIAAHHGNRVVVKLLVEAGAKASARDHDRCTPYDLAIKQGHHAVATFLRE